MMDKAKKQTYSGKQIFLMFIIVLFVFPILFMVCSSLAWTPFMLYFMKFGYPTEGLALKIVSGLKLLAYFIGLFISVWISYKIWPKRVIA